MHRFFTAFTAALFLAGCSQKPGPVNAADVADTAGRIQEAVYERRTQAYKNLVSTDAVLEKITELLPYLKREKDAAEMLGEMLVFSPQNGSFLYQPESVHGFVKVKEYTDADNNPHLVFRLVDTAGKIDYIDYELVMHEGELLVADYQLYLSGLTLVQQCAMALATAFPEPGSDAPGDADRYSAIIRRLNEGDTAGALTRFEKLSAAFKKTAAAGRLQMQLSANAGHPPSLNAAAEKHLAAFPADGAGLYLQMAYLYEKAGVYNEAHAAAKKLGLYVNKDPGAGWLQARYLDLMGLPRDALSKLEDVLPSLADLPPVYLLLASLYCRMDKTGRAREVFSSFNGYMERFGAVMNERIRSQCKGL